MHNSLDDYLAQVEKRLQMLPAEERLNELRELRLHLESLITASRELGNTEEEATAQALAQFGHAPTIAQELTRVRRRHGIARLDTLLGVTLFNYLIGAVVSLILSHLFVLSFPLMGIGLIAFYLRGLLTTCAVGLVTGAVLPQNAVRGTLLSHLVGMSLMMLYELRIVMTGSPQRSGFFVESVLITVAGIIVAMLGAKAGSHWRTRRMKLKTA